MNELRTKYKSFSEGLEDFLAIQQAQERDCGNYEPMSQQEKERLTKTFKSWWEMDSFALPKGNWW